MAWINLFIAALFEVAWTFTLKYINFERIASIRWVSVFKSTEYLLTLASLLAYVVFGLGNIFFFSQAMKHIPTATALATWMGITLIGVKLVDITVYKEPYHISHLFYMGFILIGVIGLKK